MENPFLLTNKTILVTGLDNEVGRIVAIHCAKLGGRIVMVHNSEDDIRQLMAQLPNNDHVCVVGNLYDLETIDEIIRNVPNIDGWSNNIMQSATILTKSVSQKTMKTLEDANVHIPVILLQKLVKGKKLNNPSSVVFTSSVSGVYTVHFADSLNALVHGAINGFAKGAALDLARQGIRVNTLNMGVVECSDTFADSILSEEELNEKRNYFPLKRFGSPQDVANATAYFLSDASSWITGVHIPVDGGYTLL